MKSVLQNCGPCVDREIMTRLGLYLVVQIVYKKINHHSSAPSFFLILDPFTELEKIKYIGFGYSDCLPVNLFRVCCFFFFSF